MNLTIRPATLADAQALHDIYTDAKRTQYGIANFEKLINEPGYKAVFDQMIESQTEDFKCWVACDDFGEVLGFSAMQPMFPSLDPLFRCKIGYVSTYIKRSEKAKGIGSKLFQHNMTYCREHTSLDYIFGAQDRTNMASVRVTDEAGFEVMGLLDKLSDYPPMSLIYWTCKD